MATPGCRKGWFPGPRGGSNATTAAGSRCALWGAATARRRHPEAALRGGSGSGSARGSSARRREPVRGPRDAPEGLGTGPRSRTEPCDAWLLGSPRSVCSREGLTSVFAGGFDGCQRRWQPCTNWRRACESRVCPVGVERLRVAQPFVASVVGRMRKSIMSRSSSETQSLRRSAQPTRPCAEAHALPHAQRSSVSYALSPPRSHGTAPRPTGPLRRVPSLNLARPRSGSSRRSHAQRSAVAPDPWGAAPRARRRHSRTAFGGVACRARHGREAAPTQAAVCSIAPRALSLPRRNRTRLRGP